MKSWKLAALYTSILCGTALWLSPFPPSVDWPQHIAQSALLAKIDDPQFTPYYFCRAPFRPYHLFHYAAAWLYSALGPELLSPVLLTLAFSIFAAGTFTAFLAFRSDLRLYPYTIPLFFSYTYWMGFAPNLEGLGLFFFTIAGVQFWKTGKRKTGFWLTQTALALSLLLHPLPFFAALTGAVLGLLADSSFREINAGKNPLKNIIPNTLELIKLLGLPILAGILYLSYLSQNIKPSAPSKWKALEPNILQKIWQIPRLLWGGTFPHHIETGLAILWLFTLGIYLYRNTRQNDTNDYFLPTNILYFIALYLLLPQFFFGTLFVYQRFLILPIALLLLWTASLNRQPKKPLLILFFAITTAFGISNLSLHWRWKKQVSPLINLVKRVPTGSRVIGLLAETADDPDRLTLYRAKRHLHILAQIYRGGDVRYSFVHYRHLPVQQCEKLPITWGEITIHPRAFKLEKYGQFTDYILIYFPLKEKLIHFYFPWLKKTDLYQIIDRRGRWLLIKVKL